MSNFLVGKVFLRNSISTIMGDGGMLSQLDDLSYWRAPIAASLISYGMLVTPNHAEGALEALFAPALTACDEKCPQK